MDICEIILVKKELNLFEFHKVKAERCTF